MSEIYLIWNECKILTSSPIDSLIGGGVEKGVITSFAALQIGKTNRRQTLVQSASSMG